jgi:putative RNA 2'-phosphotransferase
VPLFNEKQNTRLSKFLSLILRHKPGTIGLILDENGWADTNDLIEKINRHGYQLDIESLTHIVETNNKQRFSFGPNKTKIRANQGHSIEVELGLPEKDPPAYLYHGTGEKSVTSILATGLEKRGRQFVHLSRDVETARSVGQRHGRPVVLIVAAGKMRSDGYSFYLSENNVWLTANVPPQYLVAGEF